jgi:hypothetical protein
MCIKNQFKIADVLNTNFHFIWVVLFFIIKGYNDQGQAVPVSKMFFLFLSLTAVSTFCFWLFNKYFKSPNKTGLFISIALILVLFFGAFQDAIASVKLLAPVASLKRFSVIVFALLLVLLIWIKNTKQGFNKPAIFVNALFLMYLLVEATILAYGMMPGQKDTYKSQNVSTCDTCLKPDVYLIVLDEYFGSTGLREYFGFDNYVFEQFLKHKGFNVLSNTTSNYILTLFSTASMLNMDYLNDLGALKYENHYAYKTALSMIESNKVIRTFRNEGYRIDNKSVFDLHDAPAEYSTASLPSKLQLINNKTLYHRIAKALPPFLAKKMKLSRFVKNEYEQRLSANRKRMEVALEEAAQGDSIPTFTYIHLHMPHDPYAFDSTGKRITPFWQRKSYSSKEVDEAYLQYLVYTNKKISQFLQQLMEATNNQAVIVLMSDHGYRGAFRNGSKIVYQTLNAVYMPHKSTAGWYNGMTNVNQFRLVFNALFNLKFPLLKDSISR